MSTPRRPLKTEQIAEWLKEWSRNVEPGTRAPTVQGLARRHGISEGAAYDAILIAREAGWITSRRVSGSRHVASRPGQPAGPVAPEHAEKRAADAVDWTQIQEVMRSVALERGKDAPLATTLDLARHFNVDPGDLRENVLKPLSEAGWLQKVGRGEDYATGPGPARPVEPPGRQAPPTPEESAESSPKVEPVADTRWPTVLDEIVAANRSVRDDLPSWDDYEPAVEEPADPSEPGSARLREPGEHQRPEEQAERSGPAQQPADADRRWELESPVEDPGDLDGPR